MSGRPLKIPGHRPLSRPEDRERPFADVVVSGSSVPRRSGGADPRLGQLARCLSRGRRPGTAVAPVRAISDATSAREAALRRLRRVCEAHAEGRQVFTEVRRELVDALLHVRLLSLEAVEAIESWRAGNRGTGIWRDQATGENYLLKMKDDTRWMAESPLGEILYFSPKSDPFFVVPSTHDCPSAPTNQMTPTLQARRHSQMGDQQKAVLPLPGSLLKRIRKAELVILKESVRARLQQPQGASSITTASEFVTPTSVTAGGHRETSSGAPAQPEKPPLVIRDDFSKVQAHLLTASLGVLEEVLDPTRQVKLEGVTVPRPSTPLEPVPPRPRPLAPVEPTGSPLCLRPVEASVAEAKGVFERYALRAEKRLLAALESWKALQAALTNPGPEPLEWYWLVKPNKTSAGPDEADGLVIFRLRRTSMVFGQMLHISVVDIALLDDALNSVKVFMFTLLPIRSIRVTLWHEEKDGELKLDKEVEGYFKRCRFRWFQLTNMNGCRGSVMEGRRFAPPDCEDGPDPVKPEDIPCIEFCLGQVWLRGTAETGATKRLAPCAQSLVLAAACLRCFFARDAGEATRAADAAVAPARELAREGLVRALLSGELDKRLQALEPVELQEAELATDSTNGSASAALALRLARGLEAASKSVPAVLCEIAEDAADLVRRGGSARGYVDAASGLGLEDLPSSVAALSPEDAAFGRLFVTLEWHSVTVVDDSTFEVPVHVSGMCSKHQHPVFYLATSEEDMFLVIIPWEGIPRPSDENVFVVCTELLRATKPVEKAPFGALRLPNFDARRTVQTSEIADAGTLGMPRTTSLHVAEFASLSVTSGRRMPGCLSNPDPGRAVFSVERPFAVTLWHNDIDELNVPLVATMVA